MKVTVFGANGRVGRLVVDALLAKNHNVVAFVHGDSPFETNPALKVVQGDIHNSEQVNSAVQGVDAVISTLGSWGTKTKDIQVMGMKKIVPAMQKNSIKRIISLTGSEAYVTGDKKTPLFRITHPIFSVLAGKILRDGEQHINELQQSGLDWTVVRSPVMKENGDPSRYTLSNRRSMPWDTIHRLSVANAMVEQLSTPRYSQKSPFLQRS